jgi:hypothetical protein
MGIAVKSECGIWLSLLEPLYVPSRLDRIYVQRFADFQDAS